MRLPDATDQIRLAPVRALRAVFTGVGQLLLAADRLREEDAGQDQETGEDQHDSLASAGGQMSASVRLISSTGMPIHTSPGPGGGKGGRSKPAGGEPGRGGRKAEPAGRKGDRAASGKPERSATARSASPARADRSGKATKPTARGGDNGDDARGATSMKAGNAGSGRRSGRLRSSAEPSRFRSLDLTGNVRMLTDQDISDLASDELERSADPAPADPAPAGPAPAGPAPGAAFGALAAETRTPSWSDAAPAWSSWSTSTAETPPDSPPAAELPISGYADLSLPSLRARLRNLGAAELRDLLAHERSHANREDVVTMFERRIAKLADAD